jgi:hypothetical protein
LQKLKNKKNKGEGEQTEDNDVKFYSNNFLPIRWWKQSQRLKTKKREEKRSSCWLGGEYKQREDIKAARRVEIKLTP